MGVLPSIACSSSRPVEAPSPILGQHVESYQLARLCKLRSTLSTAISVNCAYGGCVGSEVQNMLKRYVSTDGMENLDYARVRETLRYALRIPPSVVSDGQIS